MTKQFILLFLLSCSDVCAYAQAGAGRLTTPWTADVSSSRPWPEYPQPQMMRKAWKNLNGPWDYAILPKAQPKPEKWQGKILVPYPVESSLSGVQKKVGTENRLWYRKQFTIPGKWRKRFVVLHFEAVDWDCQLWVNGREAGNHKGGYDAFAFDISPFLKGGKNEIVLSVYDPTDKGWQPLGKQVLDPGGIFYTSVTGIWQTVWLEPLAKTHIADYHVFPDIDISEVQVRPEIVSPVATDEVIAEVSFGGKSIGVISGKPGENLRLPIPNAKLWAPGTPNLYDLKLKIQRDGKLLDEVSGYFGMRKVSLGKDADGFTKIFINNKFLFENGPLDQGFWPDGIYTPPTEAAMKHDLEMMQKMGFNMLRKHVKVEPQRFYYWCDKMGILVWQDMPNGDAKIEPDQPDIKRSAESSIQFEIELKQLIFNHFNHPSIIMWVPFNEGWGQFQTDQIVHMVKQLDPTRLVDDASGWADRKTGDVLDWHHYPNPACPPAEENRAIVLGEFGGLGLKTPGHMWEEKNWGYSNYATPEAMLADYEKYYAEIWNDFTKKGLSACIYTQITDVETEANGLMTYDRKVVKADVNDLYQINTGNFIPAPRIMPFGGMMNTGDSVALKSDAGVQIRYTFNGAEPDQNAPLYVAPIPIRQDGLLKVRAYSMGKKSRVGSAQFTITDKPRPQYAHPYHERYPAGFDFALIDGKTGSDQFNDGAWQGFNGPDLEVTFELKSVATIQSVTAGFLENTGAWIFPPKKITVFLSTDGRNFQKAAELMPDQPGAYRPARIERPQLKFAPQQAKFIRLKAENPGVCPEWHDGKGKNCWIFADEATWE